MQIKEIKPNPDNPRTIKDEAFKKLCESIKRDPEFMVIRPIVVDDNGVILGGNMRYRAIQHLGMKEVPDDWVVKASNLTEEQQRRFIIVDNAPTGMAGDWDIDMLANKWDIPELLELGFDLDSLSDLDIGNLADGLTGSRLGKSTLREKFVVPPLSVLDTRLGYWQDRKKAWKSLGIASETGRKENALYKSKETKDPKFYYKKAKTEKLLGREISAKDFKAKYYQGSSGAFASGTSIFDPVLCEIMYRWFTPPQGVVLDPFAGGSVRGIVASVLGRDYVGVDLRQEQVDANREQYESVRKKEVSLFEQAPLPTFDDDNMPQMTCVEKRGSIWVKRNDEFVIGGGRGGKVRTCWSLAQGATGLVTAGSRSSPQVNIVAQIARKLGIPCRVHTPTGELSPEVRTAEMAGAEIVQHKAGYNNVIIARAREDAKTTGWREIPFEMECQEAIDATAAQVENIPSEAKRIVIPVGSGMSLAGLLHGLIRYGKRIPVIGVIVGADPTDRLDKYAPKKWREMVDLVKSDLKYDEYAKQTTIEGLELDPIYEAKCIPFIKPDDLLWVVGIRATAATKSESKKGDVVWHAGDSQNIDKICEGIQADFVFSCPPYYDLEVYSDDPRDLSNMNPDAFIKQYRDIIAKTCALLKNDRFAVFVVGEVRDSKGIYRRFVPETIQAFEDAGLRFYNDIVLVNAIGTVSMRVANQMVSSRKIGKVHQNVLVFVKGDPTKAAVACGPVEAMSDDECAALFGGNEEQDNPVDD